jgi:hypothetical protein
MLADAIPIHRYLTRLPHRQNETYENMRGEDLSTGNATGTAADVSITQRNHHEDTLKSHRLAQKFLLYFVWESLGNP